MFENIFYCKMTMLKLVILMCIIFETVSSSEKLVVPLRMKRAAANVMWQDNNLRGHVEKGYYAEVLIGTPPQALNILIDTGSSNFAVAGSPNPKITKYYDAAASSTKIDSKRTIDIKYTEGYWTGELLTDIVSIPSAGLNSSARVSLAEITSSEKFFMDNSGWQGILGMGYTELVRPEGSNSKSFMENVVTQTKVEDVFSLQLCTADVSNLSDETSGTFIIGGYNESIAPDDIYWTKVVRAWYYEVRILGMKVGNTTVDVDCEEFNNDKTIVDSGTTNLHLPTKVFDEVIKLIKLNVNLTNYTLDRDFLTGITVLCWPQNEIPYDSFPVLTIYLPSEAGGSIALSLYPRHYLLYYGVNQKDPNSICFKLGLSSSQTGTVLGAVLMEQYIVIFDRLNTRVGITKSDCSENSEIVHFPGYPNTTSCVYSSSKDGSMQIIMYVMLGLVILCAFPACVLFCWSCYNKKNGSAGGDDRSVLLTNPSK